MNSGSCLHRWRRRFSRTHGEGVGDCNVPGRTVCQVCRHVRRWQGRVSQLRSNQTVRLRMRMESKEFLCKMRIVGPVLAEESLDTSNRLLVFHSYASESQELTLLPFDRQAAAAGASTSDAPVAAHAVPAALATEGQSLPPSSSLALTDEQREQKPSRTKLRTRQSTPLPPL